MKKKNENISNGLRLKGIRERLGLGRNEFCQALGGCIAYKTLQSVELGYQPVSKKVLTAAEELEKRGVGVTLPANPAPVAEAAKGGAEGVARDDLEAGLLRLFRQVGIVRRAQIVAALAEEVQGKKGGASGVGESGGEAGRCVGKAC